MSSLRAAMRGNGFDGVIKGSGNGLKNMQSRIKEIGGDLIISSAPDAGTKIKIQLSYPFKIPPIGCKEKTITYRF